MDVNKIAHMTPKSSAPARRPSPAALRLARAMLSAGCILSATTAALADGRVSGRVSDAGTQAALPGAEVAVTGSSARAITGSDGAFALDLPAGEYELTTFYLGYPSSTLQVTVVDGQTTPVRFSLGGDEIVTLEAMTVEGTREGQARALNQQRTATNLTSIVSSDLAGQFPDKTVADAVRRLPGVTVETDTDTGGSEGRYITIRGLNADFNAVSVNGMRASVSDFGGLSRRVPLDVVSAKSADQIEVTKALRPDQDGDGIGGAVNIVTRGPFDRDGVYLTAEAALGYSDLADDYTGNYPYGDPEQEYYASFSSPLGTEGKHGLALSVNQRDRSFLKQRVGTTGWSFDGTAYSPSGTGGAGVALQHFFDDVRSRGLTATYEWRPTANNKFRVDFSHSERETERGRQRLFYRLFDGIETNAPDEVSAVDTDGDGTYDNYTSDFARVDRIVRQFFETQEILNLVARGETTTDNWKFDYLVGANRGTFDGDPRKDISARFESNSSGTTSFQANGDTPELGFSRDEFDPSLFRLRSLDRGSSFVTDEELAVGLDLTRDATFAGGTGFWKFGAKTRLFDRDYVKVENFFFRPSPNLLATDFVADYRANRTLAGAYDYGFFLDPNRIRAAADAPGGEASSEPASDNLNRSIAGSYQAGEDIHAGYAMGQFAWGRLTALSGLRLETSRVGFTGHNGTIDTNGDMVAVTPFDESADYLDVLPSLHFRYEQSSNLLYRFAITRSVARPRLGELNPSALTDNDAETISVGDINLDPIRSTNLDLGLEYYFTSAGVLSAGLFYKDMTDNIYTTRTALPGGDTLIRPANAKDAWVRGFELGYDHQFTFLPAPLDGLGAFVNYTYADSEVDTGLAEFSAVKLPLFNQVETTINAGLFYEKSGFRSRVALIYRSESLIDIQTDAVSGAYDPNLSRYLDSSVTLDLTASYQFAKNWQVFSQFSNLLNEPGQAYDGTKARLDYYEITDWSATLGLRWNL
jgi:TonB-dependent receptor